jgi:hypothetical protein
MNEPTAKLSLGYFEATVAQLIRRWCKTMPTTLLAFAAGLHRLNTTACATLQLQHQ